METMEFRVARLRTCVAEGRIVRHLWQDAAYRQESLLGALSQEVVQARDPAACPEHVMPAWLARITPIMEDFVSATYWPTLVRRYADLAGRWHALDSAAWRRAEFAARAISVREAVRYTRAPGVIAVCTAVVALCDRGAVGDMPTAEEWASAAAAAEVEAEAAVSSEAAEAAAAARGADAWASSLERTQWAGKAARASAWNRMADAILDVIEEACSCV